MPEPTGVSTWYPDGGLVMPSGSLTTIEKLSAILRKVPFSLPCSFLSEKTTRACACSERPIGCGLKCCRDEVSVLHIQRNYFADSVLGKHQQMLR
jgi:hypothetical protein